MHETARLCGSATLHTSAMISLPTGLQPLSELCVDAILSALHQQKHLEPEELVKGLPSYLPTKTKRSLIRRFKRTFTTHYRVSNYCMEKNSHVVDYCNKIDQKLPEIYTN